MCLKPDSSLIEYYTKTMNGQVLITLTQRFSIYIISNKTKQILYHLLSSRPYALTVAEDRKILQVQHHFPAWSSHPYSFVQILTILNQLMTMAMASIIGPAINTWFRKNQLKPALRVDQEPWSLVLQSYAIFVKQNYFRIY